MTAYTPPWLEINPKDFTQAAEEGGKLGVAAAENAEKRRSDIASEALEASRIGAAQQEAAQRNALGQSEAAQSAMEEAQKLGLSRQELAQKGDISKLPYAMTTGRGGVGTFDPATGTWKTIDAGQPYSQSNPETPDDRMKLEQYRSYSSARDAALRAGNNDAAQKYQSELDALANPKGAGAATPTPSVPPISGNRYSFTPGLFGGTITDSAANPLNQGSPSQPAAAPAPTATATTPQPSTYIGSTAGAPPWSPDGGNPLNTGGTATAAPAPTQSNFTKGQQVIQNGVTYQFDGQNWNPAQ